MSKDPNAEEKFMELHESYLMMIGKGETKDAPSDGRNSWEFHDWYWKFAMTYRRRAAAGPDSYSQRPESEQASSRAQLHQQLNHLKSLARQRQTAAQGAVDRHVEPPLEVHPAWSASASSSRADSTAGLSQPPDSRESGAEIPDSELGTKCTAEHFYTHRPPGIATGHLSAQLSGLKRKARIRKDAASTHV